MNFINQSPFYDAKKRKWGTPSKGTKPMFPVDSTRGDVPITLPKLAFLGDQIDEATRRARAET